MSDQSVGGHLPTARCRSYRHVFQPFVETDDPGGGAQRCECGLMLIDRTLGGGRVVEYGQVRGKFVGKD
jgi:hypothetical protein